MLATALAHEIKNPVALALAYTGLIRQIGNTPEIEEYCNLIQQSLLDVGDLVHELLYAAQLGTEPTDVNITMLLTEMLNEYRVAMPGISFAINSDPVHICHANERYIRLIFSNLLKNAVEAADMVDIAEIGWVLVSVTRFEDALQVSICNNGVLGEHKKPHSSGMGLGICEWLIKQLGGELNVQNNTPDVYTAEIILPV